MGATLGAYVLSPVMATRETFGPRTRRGEKGHHATSWIGFVETRTDGYLGGRAVYDGHVEGEPGEEERMLFDWKEPAGVTWVGMWSWRVPL